MPKRKYNFNYNYSYSSKFSSLSSSLSFLCYTLLLKLAFLFFYSLSSSRSTTVFAFFLSSSKIYPVSQKIPKTVWRGNLFSETRSRLTWSCQKSFIASSLFPLSCCSYLKNNILDTIQAGSASIISGKNKNRFLLSYQGLTAYSPSICKSSPFFIVDWSASSFPSRTLQPLKSQRMFSSTSPNNSNDDNGNTGIPSPLYFGPWNLDRSQVFYHSEHVLGIVNLKPLVPGHVLIIPKRVVNRIADLSPSELQDLFSTVQIVGPTLEKHFGASALNIAIQDGNDLQIEGE